MSDSKTIAKNTGFLYVRMFVIMAVQLYMSRVVLDKLGADDYGLYNVVGGVVGLLSFLTGTLSIGTSRFITFELGAGDSQKLRRTFVTSFYTHVALSILIVILLESAAYGSFTITKSYPPIVSMLHFGFIKYQYLPRFLPSLKCHTLLQ